MISVRDILILIGLIVFGVFGWVYIYKTDEMRKKEREASKVARDYRGIKCDCTLTYQTFLWWMDCDPDHKQLSYNFSAYGFEYFGARYGFVTSQDAFLYQQWLQNHPKYLHRTKYQVSRKENTNARC